jgi:UDP-N-acetylglucosamine transferase subunit ALG13
LIFVTVGTNEAPFDRLVEAVSLLPANEEIFVQCGASAVRPPNPTCHDFMLFDDLVAEMRRAQIVVTHAGIGSIMSALASGKRPVVVPRLARYGEAVDDHQLPVARRLESSGLVTLVETPASLGAAVSNERSSPSLDEGTLDVDLGPDERLVAELREYISAHTGPYSR